MMKATDKTTIKPANCERLDHVTLNLDNLSTLPTFDDMKAQEDKAMMKATDTNTTTMTQSTDNTTADNIVNMPTVDIEALREKASKAAHTLSAAMASDSVKRIEKARIDAQASIDEYNAAFMNKLFARFLESDVPTLEAVKVGYWRKMRLVTKNNDNTQCVEIGYSSTVIDLTRLEKAAGERHIMHKASWRIVAEKLAYQYAMRATKDIGGDVERMKRLYDVSEYARDDRHFWDDGKRPADPTSSKQLIAVTQKALDAILFVEGEENEHNKLRVNSHDLHYILYTAFKKGKEGLTVSMPRQSTIIAILTEVAYRLVNNLSYTSEYREIEKKEAAA